MVLTQTAKADIIKLPLSRSGTQLLRDESSRIGQEKDIRQCYGNVIRSGVYLVLRESNSDHRAVVSVREYAIMYPHSVTKQHGCEILERLSFHARCLCVFPP